MSAPNVAPHGAIALARHAPRSGARVLDVGCGFGETTLDLARLVGPKGSVVGVDACELSLGVARADARAARAANVEFIAGDVASYPFMDAGAGFDVVFSLFAMTSFEAPEAALQNVRDALKPGGRALIVTWCAADANPWVAVPMEIARRHLPHHRRRSARPFSMADEEVVRSLLERAGFADLCFEVIDVPMVVARSVTDAIEFQLDLGPAGEIVAAAGELRNDVREALIADLRAGLEPYVTPRGVVMASSSWCIMATSPT